MVADWCKQRDLLVATGNVQKLVIASVAHDKVAIMKLWDVNRELSVADVPTQTHSAVTCIKTDNVRASRALRST